MNVYDKVNELARALKETQEVIDYKKASERVNNSEENKKMVDEFRKKQLEMYSLQMQVKDLTQDQKDGIEKLWNVIALHADVRDYFEKEMRFSRLWEDIMKTLSDAVDLKLDI